MLAELSKELLLGMLWETSLSKPVCPEATRQYKLPFWDGSPGSVVSLSWSLCVRAEQLSSPLPWLFKLIAVNPPPFTRNKRALKIEEVILGDRAVGL